VGAAGIGSRRSQLATRYEAARRGDRLGAPRRNTPFSRATVILRGDHLVRLPRRASACRATVTVTVLGTG